MATSGTFNYNPLVNEIMDEAFEVAGVDPRVPGGAHIKSFGRSLKLMLNSEWSTIGINNWMVTEETHTLSVGETQFALDPGSIDIVEAVLRRPGSGIGNASDTEMYQLTRNEYFTIVDKQNQGRPDRWWLDRQAVTKTVNYWQAGSNTTDQIVYNVFRQTEDYSGDISENLGIPVYAFAALCAGMAAKMALKYNPQKYELLQAIYAGPNYAANPLNPGGLLGMLRSEDRDRGDIDLALAFEPRTGRR